MTSDVRTSRVYASGEIAAEVREQLRRAQADLDIHVTSCATGTCLACGQVGPCPVNEWAAGVFARLGSLPRRVPGASRPEIAGARRIGAAGLLAQVSGTRGARPDG